MTVIASTDESLSLALELKRRQIGETAWEECLAEAYHRERVVLMVQKLTDSTVPFAAALKEVNAAARESTVRRWIERYKAHGIAGLVPLRGQLPHGHPDPILKGRIRRSTKPRSFIKWAGSKTGALPRILSCFPKAYRTYYEPMVGSGVVFFALAPEKAVLADINPEIICAYEVLRDRVDELREALKRHANTSEHYLKIRAQDPDSLCPVERAARFIYLNKTCFNGMYRVNRKGRFNVPYGRIGHANICDEWTLAWTSRMLDGVQLRAGDYRNTLNDAGDGDLVYLDPPYLVPRAGSRKCHLYQPEAFDEAKHQELAAFVRELISRGCDVVVSNANISEVHDLYRGLDIQVVEVRRPINRNSKKRAGHHELIIVGRPVASRSSTHKLGKAFGDSSQVASTAANKQSEQMALPLASRTRCR